jgi:hypothetical protein
VNGCINSRNFGNDWLSVATPRIEPSEEAVTTLVDVIHAD